MGKCLPQNMALTLGIVHCNKVEKELYSPTPILPPRIWYTPVHFICQELYSAERKKGCDSYGNSLDCHTSHWSTNSPTVLKCEDSKSYTTFICLSLFAPLKGYSLMRWEIFTVLEYKHYCLLIVKIQEWDNYSLVLLCGSLIISSWSSSLKLRGTQVRVDIKWSVLWAPIVFCSFSEGWAKRMP